MPIHKVPRDEKQQEQDVEMPNLHVNPAGDWTAPAGQSHEGDGPLPGRGWFLYVGPYRNHLPCGHGNPRHRSCSTGFAFMLSIVPASLLPRPQLSANFTRARLLCTYASTSPIRGQQVFMHLSYTRNDVYGGACPVRCYDQFFAGSVCRTFFSKDSPDLPLSIVQPGQDDANAFNLVPRGLRSSTTMRPVPTVLKRTG